MDKQANERLYQIREQLHVARVREAHDRIEALMKEQRDLLSDFKVATCFELLWSDIWSTGQKVRGNWQAKPVGYNYPKRAQYYGPIKYEWTFHLFRGDEHRIFTYQQCPAPLQATCPEEKLARQRGKQPC